MSRQPRADQIDIVYPLRVGDENEELRYSLRSLANVPHGTVHLTGFIPSWINGALNKIPVPGHPNKYRSAENNLLAAIESPAVSDPFWLFNDDFFLVRQLRSIPRLHRGSLADLIDYYLQRHSGHYVQGMQHARDLLLSLGIDRPLLSYELHAPLLVRKQPMADVLEMRGKQDCYHLRTVYGNLVRLGGKATADVKVYRNTADDFTAWPMVSTSDMLFRYGKVGRWLRSLFPDRSQYER